MTEGRPVFMKRRTEPATPFCRGRCFGTERAVWDSPASFGKTSDGRKLVFCRCCEREMVLQTGLAAGIADAPNIAPGIDQSQKKRYYCPQCDFDVVTLPELKAKA